MTEPVEDPADTMLRLLTGGWVAQIVRALAVLRFPDFLADGPSTAEELAERAGTDARATYRLMRAASSVGVLSYEGKRRFALTGTGQLLRSDRPGSMRSLVMVQNGRAHWRSWELFPEAVRQGRSQTDNALGAPLFEYFAQPENAEEAALFARAMGDLSGLVTRGVVATLETVATRTVVDIGGADGDLLFGLLADNPNLTGRLLDLPHVVDGAARAAEERGLGHRFAAVAGDFFVDVPSGDLYLLKMIMHDWDDAECVTILRNCRAAATENGRAVVVEMLIGELGTPDFATRVDMNMLSVTHGMEREPAEYDALFRASGWRRVRTYPVGGGYSAMELEIA